MSAKPKAPTGVERRKTPRKDVLETFSVFLVLPKHGVRKMYLTDVSDGGLGFYAEVGDEFKTGETVPCLFYINPTLKLPLTLKIVRTGAEEAEEGPRQKVGCEFADTASKPYKAFSSFISLLDELSAFIES